MAKDKNEGQKLADDVPEYMRLKPASTSTSVFEDKPSSSDDGHQEDDDTTPPAPSISIQTSEPQPTPSPSGFLSSLSGKGKNPSKNVAKALGMDDDDYQKFMLTAELIRQTMGGSDNEKFSVANPDKFDGTKPEKLETFEAQCRSVYLSNERKYTDPSRQALFAGSYLEGAAFEWWKGELKKSTADFKASAPQFWINLRNRFGNPEYGRILKERLTFLHMKETDHVNRHITTFENLASQTSWNEEALRSRLYWSLPRRLREDLTYCDPATITTLAGLKTRVLQIDRLHWEHQDEIRREKGRQGHSDGSGGSKKSPRQSSPPSSSPPSSSPPSHGPPRNQNKPTPAPSTFTPRPNTDASGRITAEERKRRMDNKLCLYCGKEGHGVKNCPVSDAKSKKKAAGNSSKN